LFNNSTRTSVIHLLNSELMIIVNFQLKKIQALNFKKRRCLKKSYKKEAEPTLEKNQSEKASLAEEVERVLAEDAREAERSPDHNSLLLLQLKATEEAIMVTFGGFL